MSERESEREKERERERERAHLCNKFAQGREQNVGDANVVGGQARRNLSETQKLRNADIQNCRDSEILSFFFYSETQTLRN